ncbi:homeodomain-like protein [Tanacetum coccineum]|uniref:Homeodomain-like protein n=1 Tax=Tanacetum coccineum TaxID=301880 RepID=A0ABQ5IWT9_9ASTR
MLGNLMRILKLLFLVSSCDPIALLRAICVVLFAAPSTPGARMAKVVTILNCPDFVIERRPLCGCCQLGLGGILVYCSRVGVGVKVYVCNAPGTSFPLRPILGVLHTRYAVSSPQNSVQLFKPYQSIIPFPSRLIDNSYEAKEVLEELMKLQTDSNKSATNLKGLLKERWRMDDEIEASINVHSSEILEDALPPKEKDSWSFTLPCNINNICFEKALADLGANISVMPYSTFTNLSLGELAPTKLIIELADRTVKRPKGLAENMLVGFGKFFFPVDFIVLDMPEDIKIPLILRRPFLSTAHAKIDVFKRKFSLRVRNDKIVFKSNNPTSTIIKKVYVLGLRERMELDLEARIMGEALILDRSQDPEFGYFLELNDLNEPLELRRNQEVNDLGPTIDEGEVIDKLMVNIVKTRHDDEMIEGLDEYLSFCDYDMKIHINYAYNLQFSCMIGFEHVNANFFPILSINVMSKKFYNSTMKDKIVYRGKNVVGAFTNVPIFVGNFSVVSDFAVAKNIDAYRDKDIGDVIVGKLFCRASCVEARRFDGFITIHDGNDNVTYQMAQSHPRFKHLTNAQCNKIRPLLKVSARDKLKGISHPYQKLKGFYKGVLNLGPKYIRDAKTVEWLTCGHVSVHEME